MRNHYDACVELNQQKIGDLIAAKIDARKD